MVQACQLVYRHAVDMCVDMRADPRTVVHMDMGEGMWRQKCEQRCMHTGFTVSHAAAMTNAGPRWDVR